MWYDVNMTTRTKALKLKHHGLAIGEWIPLRNVLDHMPLPGHHIDLASRLREVLDIGTDVTLTFTNLDVTDMSGVFPSDEELSGGQVVSFPTFVDIEPELLPYVVFKRELSGKIDRIMQRSNPLKCTVVLTVSVDAKGNDIDLNVPLHIISAVRFNAPKIEQKVDVVRVKLPNGIEASLEPTRSMLSESGDCTVRIGDVVTTRYRVSGLLAMACGMCGWCFKGELAREWFDDTLPSLQAQAAFMSFACDDVEVSVDAFGLHVGCKHVKWTELDAYIDALAGLLGWDA